MKITLNGETTDISGKMNIAQLIEHFGYKDKGVAVAVNMTFIAIDRYNETILNEGDEVEILGPVQGG